MKKSYAQFLRAKVVSRPDLGFKAELLSPQLFKWQRDIVSWALSKGKAALFEDCGLGKTPQQLEFARQVYEHTKRPVLIAAPLAVSQQTIREGRKFGIHVQYEQSSNVRYLCPITITNYERLTDFDPSLFSGVILDESGILKNYMGKLKRFIIEAFRQTRFKLACTATPAPNDHMELGNHAEFLDVMPANEMLSRWFINDTMNCGTYSLKGHAVEDYWRWVASWAACVSKPSDLGYADDGFKLPSLNIKNLIVPVDYTKGNQETLFRSAKLTATTLHQEMRLTAPDRAEVVAAMVNKSTEPWAVWCNTNYEADELVKRIPDAVEVRGSEPLDSKERKLDLFTQGQERVIITKPGIAGYGLNWQHCWNVAFVGLSYSYEDLYQTIRRSYRFGQKHAVNVHIVTAETEGDVLNAIRRKMKNHTEMQERMFSATKELIMGKKLQLKTEFQHKVKRGKNWEMNIGDTVELIQKMPTSKVDLSIFSPPFSNLYIYSDSIRDMGNCKDDDEFFEHFDFLIPELLRVTRPGRLCAVHCKNLVNYKGRDGRSGLRDFRGEIIRHFEHHGWQYHSEVTIWNDPVLEMQRTKAHGLLYKQLRKDSSFSRQGLAEYVVIFRKWAKEGDANVVPITHSTDEFPLEVWQEWASPVWMTIRKTRVLNVQAARDDKDEKHICPLQLDVIERLVNLWSNRGELVFSPYSGIGSEGVGALTNGRRFIGHELKEMYWNTANKNLALAAEGSRQMSIFGIAKSVEDAAEGKLISIDTEWDPIGPKTSTQRTPVKTAKEMKPVTVAEMREFLKKCDSKDAVYAYEGERIGVVVKNKKGDRFIEAPPRY